MSRGRHLRWFLVWAALLVSGLSLFSLTLLHASQRRATERVNSVLRRGLVAAGRLTLLQSAELLRRCRVVVSNDSAPVHLAGGVGAPVIAIFGATSPAFGFAPRGPRDVVVETHGLPCRPCAIHGGDRCPERHFACMEKIHPFQVLEQVRQFL